MKCTEIGELLMDVAAGVPVEAPVEAHLRTCAHCADEVTSLRKTMDLLDQWQAPEPSPYFDTRLQARLRAEAARPVGWFGWLRKPVLALAVALLLVIGGMLVMPGHLADPTDQTVAQAPSPAVEDLQSLDKNHELFANFDLLDDISANQGESVNP